MVAVVGNVGCVVDISPLFMSAADFPAREEASAALLTETYLLECCAGLQDDIFAVLIGAKASKYLLQWLRSLRQSQR